MHVYYGRRSINGSINMFLYHIKMKIDFNSIIQNRLIKWHLHLTCILYFSHITRWRKICNTPLSCQGLNISSIKFIGLYIYRWSNNSPIAGDTISLTIYFRINPYTNIKSELCVQFNFTKITFNVKFAHHFYIYISYITRRYDISNTHFLAPHTCIWTWKQNIKNKISCVCV